MFTPGDIRNKSFEKVRSGYRVEEVQPFLNEAAAQIEALQSEKADLQKKLEILAEKLEQYREDEDSLRAALIGAQKLGDSVVRDAKRKAEAIIAQATRKSEEMVADAQANINREAIALNKMQVEVAKFKSHILSLYKKHIELIQEIPYDESDVQTLEGSDIKFISNLDSKPAPAAPAAPDKDEEEASAPDNKIELKFESAGDDEIHDEADELAYTEEAEDSGEVLNAGNSDAFPRKRPASRFGTLRFGEDYSLTRRE